MIKKVNSYERLYTIPSFAWMLVFFLIPSLLVYLYAFKPADVYGRISEGWTLQTIIKLWNPATLNVLARTLWLSALTTVICLVLAVPVGYHLAVLSKKTRNILIMLIIVPFWSSLLIRIFAWKILLHPEGSLHQFFVFIRLIKPETTLLYNSWAVLFVMVYTFVPFAILPVYASASKFNFQLIEAAMDLGATKFAAMRKVFLPGIDKGIAAAALMVFIPAVGTYVIPDLVGGVGSEMLGNKIAEKTLVERNIPEASALSAMLALVTLMILWVAKQSTGPQKKLRIYSEVRNRE